MKKLVLSAGLVIAAMSVSAQTTFFSESFDASIPGTWTILDEDGYSSSTVQSDWASWAWRSNGETATSSSWYDNSGTGPTDDWLITPQISVPASGVNYLFYWGSSHEASFLEEYEVLISTTGTTPGNFSNTVASITNESVNGTDHAYDISAYNGQDIYIAFHHISDDESMLHIDNVECATLPANDLGIESIAVDNRIEGNKTFTVTVKNNGTSTVSAFDLDWSFSGSATATENITGLNLTTGQTYDLDITVNSVAEGLNQTFDAEITTSDDVAGNDLMNDDFDFFVPIPQFAKSDTYGNSFDLHQRLSQGQAIVLDFMASWCGPCQSSTPEISQFVQDNGSGAGPVEALAISIESTDDNAALNALNWNGGYYAYPKFAYDNSSYTTSTAFQYSFYGNDHGLGSGGIPFFVMICPNPSDPGNSTIVKSDVGYSSGMFGAYQTELDNCSTATYEATGTEEQVLSGLTVYPNPSVYQTNVQFELSAAANVSVQMVNALGQVVFTNDMGEVNGFQNIEIQTSDLESGIYFINLNVDGKVTTKRVSVGS